ncbi:MAG: hypothetical protein M1837_005872 [Sclerophora amabilis]|nr:MAG: hypothetical protein M1837_005872 [Sclerophora amabilis]
MAPINDVHHHRSTSKTSHKAFKSRHSTKSSLKEVAKGKVSKEDKKERGHRRTPHQQVMSKIDRRNQARQRQQTKHRDHANATSVFSGRNGAPRIVAVVPLCKDVEAITAVRKLNDSLDLETDKALFGRTRTSIERFKQKLDYVLVERDLMQALNACRVADFVVFVLSPENDVDELGELMIRSIEGQGISNVITMVHGLDTVEPPKRRSQVVTSLKSYITHFFPGQDKVHSLDTRQECSNVIRSLCTTTPKGIRWKEDRSWMLVEEIHWPEDDSVRLPTGEVVLTGVIRGRGLKADRLVQAGDWGDFQIDRITAAPHEVRKVPQQDGMAVEGAHYEDVLDKPSSDQDNLQDLALEELSMTDVDNTLATETTSDRKGVLLDDHHYFSDDNSHIPPIPRRLPKGTSDYQAAWYLDDVSDSGSDPESEMEVDGDTSMGGTAMPQDGTEGLAGLEQGEQTEMAPSEAPQSEMFLDPSPDDENEELAAFRSQRKNEAAEDVEFPDEIELHPNVLARERLLRYRGLKSLRSSHWETDEDKAHEPEEWGRLLRVADYKGSKNRVTQEALIGGVPPGTRVHVHLRNVPISLKQSSYTIHPLCMFSLLRHEHKRTVVNYSISLDSEYPSPLKSKEELILQCGPRRFVINPTFSQAGHTPNNVHKYDRYLHPGRTAIATFLAPLTWGSVPALFFKRTLPDDTDDIVGSSAAAPAALELIAKGTCQPPDHNRVIAKRAILTGHPYKINKKVVTVRYMFFNADDVNWFKALQLWTRRGRSGFIKESLGTHGYFKATFDGRINPQDAVGVSLYKRVFPRSAIPWSPSSQ